jgi:multiple sugar transport system permease protein
MTMTATLSAAAPAPARRRGNARLYRVLFHTAGLFVALLFLAPIALVLLASFRPPAMEGNGLFSIQGLGFGNYGRLEDFGAGILHYAGNSLFVAVATAILTVVVSVFAGYGFSRFRFPFKAVAFVLILSTIMVPFQSILTPLFLILAKLGLQNTLSGLVLIYVTLQLPFSVFMMRNAFDAVPKEIEEAARIDGVKGLRALVYVMGPLVFPGVVSVGLFAFLNAWN